MLGVTGQVCCAVRRSETRMADREAAQLGLRSVTLSVMILV
jgi:hypothetical protein